jgi:hypothetical protein
VGCRICHSTEKLITDRSTGAEQHFKDVLEHGDIEALLVHLLFLILALGGTEKEVSNGAKVSMAG